MTLAKLRPSLPVRSNHNGNEASPSATLTPKNAAFDTTCQKIPFLPFLRRAYDFFSLTNRELFKLSLGRVVVQEYDIPAQPQTG